jgi:hypothetical protein
MYLSGKWRLVIFGTMVCSVGAGIGFGAEGPAWVANVKVTSDKVRDVSSLQAWKASYLREGMTDKDKALAIWESVVAHQYQDAPPKEFLHNDGGDVYDPLKMFNVYGYSCI